MKKLGFFETFRWRKVPLFTYSRKLVDKCTESYPILIESHMSGFLSFTVQTLINLTSYSNGQWRYQVRVLDTCLMIRKSQRHSIYLSPSEIKFSIICHQISLVCRQVFSLRFTNLAIPNVSIKDNIFPILLL